MNNIVFLAIGLGAGVLAGMFGIGGGIVIVPALMLLAKYPPQVATGTSLGSLLLPIGLLGAYAYYKEGNVRVAPALLIALGVFIGAYFGARVSLSLPPQILKRVFAVFLVLVAGQIWFGERPTSTRPMAAPSPSSSDTAAASEPRADPRRSSS